MKKLGIERQTLAVAVIPILALALLLQGYFTYTRFADLDRALLERAKLIVHQLASSSEYPVFSGNQGLLQQQVESAYAQQDVKSVVVLDADSKYLAGAGTNRDTYERANAEGMPADARDSFTLRDDRNVLRLRHRIVATQIELDELGAGRAPSQALGSVVVEVGKARLNREKTKMLLLNLALLLVVLLATMMIATRVSRRITMPVLAMNHAVRQIGQGHLDTRLNSAKVRELDELGSGINEMAHQLQQDRSSLQQRIDDATQELRRKKEEAEQANFDKSRFLAAASHDLRQPMHALGLFVGELHNRLETPEQRKIADKVEESVEAMSSLLDALLDISKLDAGIVIPQMQVVDVSAMMRRLVHDYAPVAKRKNITLHVRCIDVMVLSDPVLLERILLNLVGNAIRYTPHSGTVLLACRRRGDNLRIEVRDNGIGIPLEEQQNVFREFVQLANSARDRSKGIGLGLAIVDRLAKLLGHPLSLRSAPNRGSAFAIAVPRMCGVDELLAEPSQAADATVSRHDQLDNLRILVVDDDMLVRTSTAGILESWGCQVSVGESVQDVCGKHADTRFDLVVCDYRLPDGNGLELADRIREASAAAPEFILISGDTSPDILLAVKERGHHLLHKPVRPAKLRSLILFVLKRRKETAS